MEKAKCPRQAPELYESDSLPDHPVQRRREAAQRCLGCPVLARCADFAVRTSASDLIYAGIPLGPEGTNERHYAELDRLAQQLKGMQ